MAELAIPEQERNRIRLFTARLTDEDLKRDKSGLAATLLGDGDLDPAYIEIFDLADLTGVGLSTYLTEGLGVAELSPDERARLDGLTGPVLILLSKALHGRAARLTVDGRLSLVGLYVEERPPVQFEPLPTTTAQGILPAAVPQGEAPQSYGWLLRGLVVILALAVAVSLWLAVR